MKGPPTLHGVNLTARKGTMTPILGHLSTLLTLTLTLIPNPNPNLNPNRGVVEEGECL